MELDHPPFDAIILGCGLSESIAAASLAHVGKTVLHIDENEYYGGDQSSLTLSELVAWAKSRTPSPEAEEGDPPSKKRTAYELNQQRRFSSLSWSFPSAPISNRSPSTSPSDRANSYPDLPSALTSSSRSYSLSLSPLLIPSLSPLIQTLIHSGVSRYSTFRLLESTSIYSPRPPASSSSSRSEGTGSEESIRGTVKRVPGGKEDVFKDKSFGLADKRRLMKALMWCSGEFESSEELRCKGDMPLLSFLQSTFSLPLELAQALTYALAHCSAAQDPALAALIRVRSYLRSVGKFGSSAFLLGQYGGAGEIAQGFCRLSAVQGAIYILSHPVASISFLSSVNDDQPDPYPISVQIEGFSQPITSSHLITSSDYLPPSVSSLLPPSPSPSATSQTLRVAKAILILPSYPSFFPPPTTPPASDENEEEPAPPSPPDTSLLIFPPSSVVEEHDQTVEAILMGEGTGSCPAGQYVLYLQSPISSTVKVSSSENLFRPFIDLITRGTSSSDLPISPIFQLSYFETVLSPTSLDVKPPHSNVHIVRGPSALEAMVEEEGGRFAAEGERLFTAVFGTTSGREEDGTAGGAEDPEQRGFFLPRAPAGEDDEM